jgi:single-strand DNA-binding protein
MQKLQIIGKLTADPVRKATQSGKELATFTVAVNEKHGDKDDATFYACTAWERKAAPILTYLHKGDKVYVEGKVKARAYKTQSGEERASLDVTVDTCEFLSLKPRGDANDTGMNDGGRMTVVEDAELPF